MRRNKPFLFRHQAAFTLIELLVVVAIIGILASFALPVFGKARERAESTRCAANLRGIGVAVLSYVAENDNKFPIIEPNTLNPVYPGYSAEDEAGTLLEVLGEYGVTEQSLLCLSDVRTYDFFGKQGSSYEWSPYVADEDVASVEIITRRGVRYPKLSRIRLLMDFNGVHNGRANRLFADGRVQIR